MGAPNYVSWESICQSGICQLGLSVCGFRVQWAENQVQSLGRITIIGQGVCNCCFMDNWDGLFQRRFFHQLQSKGPSRGISLRNRIFLVSSSWDNIHHFRLQNSWLSKFKSNNYCIINYWKWWLIETTADTKAWEVAQKRLEVQYLKFYHRIVHDW